MLGNYTLNTSMRALFCVAGIGMTVTSSLCCSLQQALEPLTCSFGLCTVVTSAKQRAPTYTLAAGPCTFVDVIKRVHKTVADGLAHADVPSMQIMAQLAGQQKLLPFNALPYQVTTLHDVAPDCTQAPLPCWFWLDSFWLLFLAC